MTLTCPCCGLGDVTVTWHRAEPDVGIMHDYWEDDHATCDCATFLMRDHGRYVDALDQEARAAAGAAQDAHDDARLDAYRDGGL